MEHTNNKNFFRDVYEIVKLIPHGRVTSYGAIANYLGTKGSARMVGWAMNSSHYQADIPAHRVVNRAGCLTGKQHFNPPGRMQLLLEKEGLVVEDDQIKNFSERFWDPASELDLNED